MKRILIRAGVSPFNPISAVDMLLNNPIENNIGNMMFQNGVFRTLMTDDTEIDIDNFSIEASKERADEINETYDFYVLPLANYFQEAYVNRLKKQTQLIKQLKIPVIVMGVGLQAPFDKKIEDGFSFDDTVKDFLNAVLERSSLVGLRGEITARYLRYLGFEEEKDFTVIGCPSMYTFGRELKIRPLNINELSPVCVHTSRNRVNKCTAEFISQSILQFKNHTFIPQDIDELKRIYTGKGIISYLPGYSDYVTDQIYSSKNVQFPLSVQRWFNLQKKASFNFGARIHGTIVGVLCGTPSLLLPVDTRTLELAQYHNLNYLLIDKDNESVNLIDVVATMDFQQPVERHRRNFDHYVDFLNKNGLDHIYKSATNPKNTLYDKRVEKIKYPDTITPIDLFDIDEKFRRFDNYYPLLDNALSDDIKRRKVSWANQQSKLYQTTTQLKVVNEKLRIANKTIRNQRIIINRRVVQTALRTASFIHRVKNKL